MDAVNYADGSEKPTEIVSTMQGKDSVTTKIITVDIDGDGKLTLMDLSYALKFYETDEAACDINKDGVVNSTDYISLSD